MQYANYIAAAAAIAASSALAAPATVAAGFDVGAKVGPLSVEVAAGAELDLSLCHGAHAGLAVGAKVRVGCDFHSIDFRARMNTPAHRRYEEALEIYHDVMHLIRHTLMTRGKERALRLIEIAALIRDGEEILIVAGVLNSKDDRKVRRRWIQHEINVLESKFKRARFWAMHLPNLYLAEDIFHFAIDASLKVVEFALAVPVVVGAAIGIAIHEAAHLVARAFHFMGHVLRWAIDEIEYAFIMFAKKVKKGLKKIGHGIKAGLHAIGHGLHHLGHEIKEGLEDGVSIIVDIGHHALHHHHCHHHCSNVGLVIGDDSSSSSSSSSDDCDCEAQEDFSTVTAVCVETEKVCSKEAFTAKVTAQYNVELAWTKEECHEKVKTTLVEINEAMSAFAVDLKRIESDASAENLEE
jgi:hypothetical protein